jgi:hypothetical protein
MRCENCKSVLFDFAQALMEDHEREEVEQHLESCTNCSNDYQAIMYLHHQSQVWHDQEVPDWRKPKIEKQKPSWFMWYPVLASTAALLLMVGVTFQSTEQIAPPTNQATSADFDEWIYQWEAKQALDQTLLVDNLIETNRNIREKELQALVGLLKTEIDRQALNTDESLRYIITHQLNSQRELDDLNNRVQNISLREASYP